MDTPTVEADSQPDRTLVDVRQDLAPEEAERLEAVRQTYPGWRINVTSDGWWATRLAPLSKAQEDAGLLTQFSRDDGISLATALCQQAGIIHRSRLRS